MSKFYLLNAPVLTNYGQWKLSGPISQNDAKTLLEGEYVSAIGHKSTAQLLSKLLDKQIACQKISVTMQPKDKALVFWLKQRSLDGKELSQAEIESLPYEFGLLEFLSE